MMMVSPGMIGDGVRTRQVMPSRLTHVPFVEPTSEIQWVPSTSRHTMQWTGLTYGSENEMSTNRLDPRPG